MLSQRTRPHRATHGFTLVELLVAMTLTLLVVLAATAMLTTARQGFNTVDAASQLRDNARLATTIVQRIVDQGGFLDTGYASSSRSSEFKVANLLVNPEPAIRGYNDARYTDSRISASSNTNFDDGVNDSDMLAVRYQTGSSLPGTTTADSSMIDCSGTASNLVAQDRYDRLVSVFYVAISNTGEPALMCASRNDAKGTFSSIPLVDGVETFQVLFGVDGVVANQAVSAAPDTVVDQYLRADQLNVPGSSAEAIAATYANWQRVRSVRIGIVLRGPPGSASESKVPDQYPLGPSYASDKDAGSKIQKLNDGRLRQTVTFTMYLRNAQTP
ncbi:MAG: PilW family protein [Xylophilus ampelinus]